MVAVLRDVTFAMVFNGSATSTVAKPTGGGGAQVGDYCFVCSFGWSGFYNAGDSDNRLYVTGFAPISEVVYGSTPAAGLYGRVIDGSEGASFTCGFDSGSNRFMVCGLIEAGTYDPADPFDAFDFAPDAGTTSAVDAPTITISSTDCLEIVCYGADASTPWTPPAGFTERLDTSGVFGAGHVATRTGVSGATGTITATAGSGVAGSGQAAGFHLSINPAPSGPPTAPGQVAGLTATGRHESALLSWVAPATGGDPITDYLVEYKLTSSGTWLTFSDGTSTATTATVTGLTNLSSYDFRVSAINSIGTGTASATATATPLPVTFVAAGTKSAGGTTTVSVAYPAGSAAGQLALAFRNVWNGTATATAEAGWTSTADLSGGTGTTGDSHTGRIHVDRLEQAGSESGSVTFDQAGSPSGALGVMATYRKPSGSTWDVAAATGTDDTHGTGRAVTASSSVAFAPGDVVVVAVAMDTDTTTAFSASSLTVTGCTLSALGERVPVSTGGVTTGNDGNVGVFEATVLSGTATVAPAFSLTGGPSQCGPVAFVRLRSTSSAADVAPVATIVTVRPAVATVTAASSVNPVGSIATVRPAVAAVTATTAVNPAATVVQVRSAIAVVTATGAVTPAATRAVVVAAVAAVTATTAVNPIGTVVAPRSAVANVGLAEAVNPTTAVVTVVSAAATIAATTAINPSATVVAPRAAVAAVTATTAANPVGTTVAVRSAVADVIVGAAVMPTTAVASVRSAVAGITASAAVNPRAAIAAPVSAVSAVTATAVVLGVATRVAVVAAVANVGNSLFPLVVRGPLWLRFTTPDFDLAFPGAELDLAFADPELDLLFTLEAT